MVSLSLAPSRVRGSDLSRAHRTLCGFCCVIEPRPQRKAFSSVKTLTPRNMLDAEAQQELRDWAGFDTVMDSAASYSGATGEAFIAPVQNGRSAGALPAAEAAKLILNGNSSDIYQWVWPILVAVIFGGILLLLVILLSSFEGTHERAVPPTPQEPPMVTSPLCEVDTDATLGRCGICSLPIIRAAIGSCPHKFCAACLLERCRLTPCCPRCLTKTESVWLDEEFDAAVSVARASVSSGSKRVREGERMRTLAHYCKRLRVVKGRSFGITGTMTGTLGCVISGLTEKGMAYECGLRVSDVLVSINNIPCRSHTQIIRLLDTLQSNASRDVVDLEVECLVIPHVAFDKPSPPDIDGRRITSDTGCDVARRKYIR